MASYQFRVPPSYLAHVASSKANDFGARSSRCDVFRCGLCLLNVSAQDEGVRAQSNQGSGLHAANGSRAAGDEDDLALCRQSVISHASLAISQAGEVSKGGHGMLTEDVVSPYGAQVLGFGDGHCCDATVAKT
jgi:hypothetical protein